MILFLLFCVRVITTYATLDVSCPSASFSASYELNRYTTMGAQQNTFQGHMVATIPIDGCSTLTNAAEITGNIGFSTSGRSCNYLQ